MSEQETIADIIAEMRALSNPISDGIIAINGRIIADRLDAAHKRERGDCAKLRETMETLRELLGDLLRLGDAEYHDDFSNFCDIIDAALAEPPRNCDKYPTFNDAIRALADKRGWHDAKWDSERYCILASWLLAPATEKEGGADEQK